VQRQAAYERPSSPSREKKGYNRSAQQIDIRNTFNQRLLLETAAVGHISGGKGDAADGKHHHVHTFMEVGKKTEVGGRHINMKGNAVYRLHMGV
jgi:hypothetical protein